MDYPSEKTMVSINVADGSENFGGAVYDDNGNKVTIAQAQSQASNVSKVIDNSTSVPPTVVAAIAVPVNYSDTTFESIFHQNINTQATRNFLIQNEWSSGLQEIFIKDISNIPMRYFICDDSGSMAQPDGSRLVGIGRDTK